MDDGNSWALGLFIDEGTGAVQDHRFSARKFVQFTGPHTVVLDCYGWLVFFLCVGLLVFAGFLMFSFSVCLVDDHGRPTEALQSSRTGSELVVVTVPGVGGAGADRTAVKRFATQLFNSWGLGDRDWDQR